MTERDINRITKNIVDSSPIDAVTALVRQLAIQTLAILLERVGLQAFAAAAVDFINDIVAWVLGQVTSIDENAWRRIMDVFARSIIYYNQLHPDQPVQLPTV